MESLSEKGPATEKGLRRLRNLLRVVGLGLSVVLLVGGIFRLITRTEEIRAIIDIVLAVLISPALFYQLRKKSLRELNFLAIFILLFGCLVLALSVIFIIIHLSQHEFLRIVFDLVWAVLVAGLSLGVFYLSFRYKKAVQAERAPEVEEEEADLLTEEAIKPAMG